MRILQSTIRSLLLAPIALGLPFGAIQAAPQYIISDLGTLGGTYSSGAALNEAGQVIGSSHLTANTALHPFLWQSGIGKQDLNTLGGSHAMALGINSVGQVVGNSQIAGDTTTRGFVWNVGAMSQLSTLGGTRSRATAINDNGVMTGAASLSTDAAEHSVVWPSSLVATPTDLGTLGGSNSQGNDININGRVVGYAENISGLTHATLWTPPYSSTGQDLGTLGGSYSEAFAINAQNQVTGISSNTGDTQFRGFIWQPGQAMVDLGTLTATSTHTAGVDINNQGDVVGYSTTAGGGAKRAIVRKTGTTLADLNGLILPNTGWVLSEARAVNDAGQIVGIGTLTKVDTVNNINRVEHHAFLLTPDKEKPTITCPSAVTTTGAQPAGIGQAVASDNLDPAPTVSNNRPATFPNGDTTVLWTAADANGNTATCSQLITIGGDTTPPVVSVAIVPAAPSASGWYLVSPSINWTVTDAESAIASRTGCTNVVAVASTLPAGQAPLSCTATSGGGTSTPVSTPVIKVDTVTPVLSGVPAAFTQQASSPTGAVVNYPLPTATDTFSGISAAGVSCLPASGAVFPMGATTVNCSVSDIAGNSSNASFVVTVADQTAPDVVFNITPAAPSASGWYLTSPSTSWTVTDDESAIASRTGCATVAAQANTGATGRNVSCSATSAGGTTGPVVNNIKVDTVAPTLTGVPVNITQSTTSSVGNVVNYTLPTAADPTPGSSLNGAVSCLPASGSTFPVGVTAVNCSASDIAGNNTTATFTVTVNQADTTPPVVNFQIAPAAPNASGWYTASPSVTWSVTDVQSAITSVPCANVASVGNTLGQSFSCTATSTGGTTGPVTTPTLRVDTTAPTFTSVPVSFTRAAANSAGAVVTYTAPTASDTFSGVTAAGVSCLPASGSTMPIGNTTVSCSARDVAGNASSVSFVVTVADQTPPVFSSCPATVTLTQGQALPLLTATDNVSTPVVTRTPAGALALGTTTVNWTASDGVGLTANCAQQVTVNAAITETFSITRSQCKRRSATSGEWVVQGTSSIRTSNTIQLYLTGTVPADLTSNRLGNALTVSSQGAWQYSARTVSCRTPISLRSSASGTKRENIAVSIQ